MNQGEIMNHIKNYASVLVFAVVALGFSQAHAVDLTNRLGIGYSNQLGSVEDLPMITVNYYPNSKFAISGGLGVDTKKDESKMGMLFKVRRIIFTEKQLNFYMGGATALTTHEVAGDDKNNFELSALLGAEFFFSGLDSLAFFFETGVGVITGDGGSRFRTIGDHPFRAGITFYF
jgi:hypothetical protein